VKEKSREVGAGGENPILESRTSSRTLRASAEFFLLSMDKFGASDQMR